MNTYTLQRVFDDLLMGELSQVNLNGEDSEETGLGLQAKKTIVSHLNLGLVELYTKFPLLEREVVVQLYPELTHYHLDSNFAVSNTTSLEPIKYIVDSEYYPFTDDVLRVESCYSEIGEELYINEPSRDYSIFTPDYKSIQVPFAEEEITLTLIYRARHPVITYIDGMDANAVNILIPPYLYEALLYYIAYRVHKARHNQEARADSLVYYQQFNQRCQEVERRNMVNNGGAGLTDLLDTNGWA